jgi:membrane protein
LALFPAIIFLFSLIPYLPIPNFQNQLLDLIQGVVPKNAYEAMRETIEDIIKHQRGGLLSLGFVFAFYFTTNGFMALMRGFNTSYHVQEKRSPVKQRIVAFNLTFVLSVLLMVATALIIGSAALTKFLVKKHILKTKTQILFVLFGKWIIVLALFFIAISFLYYYAPSVKKKWRFVSAGSTFATVLTILASVGFAYFVNNFGQYNKVYGSIGTLIVVMLWIYFNSFILLLGFELNTSIHQAKKGIGREF